MTLGMEVGLSPGDFVLDGDPAPYPKRGGAPPNFRPTSIVAKRRHFIGCGPSYPQKKMAHPPHPIFGLCLLWPNGWIDEDAASYGSIGTLCGELCKNG